MKKTLNRLKTAVACAAVLAPLLFASAAGAAISQRDVLIKGPGNGAAVYYLANDGKRYVFPNQKTYDTWFTNFGGVIAVTLQDLAAYPLGGNVTYRPGIRLVKITTDPKVFAVDHDGALRWIKSELVASAIYGSDWSKKVDDVPDAFFVNYRLGADINNASDFSPSSAAAGSATINADRGLSAGGSPRYADTVPSAPPSSVPYVPPYVPPVVVPPSAQNCTADVWVCSQWSVCDSSGAQTRSCSLSTDCPNSASSTPSQAQACVPSSSGSISINVDTEAGDVAAGSDSLLAKFRFTAGYEDLRLSKVSFNVATPAAVASLRLYDADNPVSSSSAVDSNGNAFFTNLNFVIPRNTSKNLSVRGIINAVGPSGAATGANARVTIKNTSGPYVFLMQGASLGSMTNITSIPGGEQSGNDKIVRRTVPTIVVASLPTSVLTMGNNVAGRIVITASDSGDLALKTLTVDVQKPNMAAVSVSGDATHATVRQYGSGQNLAGHSTASSGCGAGSGTFCQVRTQFGPEEVIAAGSSKTYDIRLNVSGTLVKGDTLATALDGDGQLLTGALTAGSALDQVRVNGSDVNFAWSDYSGIPHSANVPGSSADWASGAYVQILPTDTQVLQR